MTRSDTEKDMRRISLVVPVYNEQESVELFYRTAARLLEAEPYEAEFLFVDDGSSDATMNILRRLHESDPRVRAVSLSRNFGKEYALTAGLRYASGDAVIPMDADLQDPPELLAVFLRHWERGADMVVGVRENRDADGRVKRWCAALFYKLFRRMTHNMVEDNAGDFRLMSRRVVDELLRLPESVRFNKGLYGWVGFPRVVVPYTRPERAAGRSKWPGWKLWNFAIDGITSFSTLPLRLWSYLGGLIALAGFAYAVLIFVRTFIYGVDVPGYASLMVVVLTLGGLILLSLGIIGEYLGRVFEEVKKRPLFIVRETVGLDGAGSRRAGEGNGERPGREGDFPRDAA